MKFALPTDPWRRCTLLTSCSGATNQLNISRSFFAASVALLPTPAFAQFTNPTVFPSPPAVETVTITGGAVEQFLGKVPAAIGDVNGDGLSDFALGTPYWSPPSPNSAGACYILFGSPAWSSSSSFDVSTLNGSRGFAVRGSTVGELLGTSVDAAGDVNGDGFGDIIIGCPGLRDQGGTIRGGAYIIFGGPNVGSGGVIQSSNIQGSVGFRVLLPQYNVDGGTVVAGVGDVDGDGYADFGLGDPGDGQPEPATFLGNIETRFLAAGDIDNDGDQDIVGSQTQQHRIVVLLNNGNGQFSISTISVNLWPEHVELTDIDHDGDLDLVVASRTGANIAQLSVLTELSNGTFGPAVNYALGATYCSFDLADINGDTFVDIVATTYDGSITSGGTGSLYVLVNNTAGMFSLTPALTTDDEPTVIAASDLDNDGDVDVAVNSAGPNGRLAVYAGLGGGVLSASPVLSPSLGAQAIDPADVDGDGDLDIVVSVGGIYWARNNGNLQFAGQPGYFQASNSPRVQAKDIDGDGDADYVAAAATDGLYVGVNNGAGVFTGHRVAEAAYSIHDVAFGDFDSDGRMDIAMAQQLTFPNSTATYAVGLARNSGPATYRGLKTGTAYVVRGAPSLTQQSILDLGLLSPAQGFTLRGIGGSERLGASIYPVGDITGDAIADFALGGTDAHLNGTGKGAYFVVRGALGLGATGTLDVHNQNGATGFGIQDLVVPAIVGSTPTQPCDFDGDGHRDLVVAAPNSNYGPNMSWGATYVIFGSPTLGSSGSVAVTSPNGMSSVEFLGWQEYDGMDWTPLGCGDINGDGYDDIFIASGENDEGGPTNILTNRGAVFVVYGRPRPYPTGVLVLNSLDGVNGFRMLGSGPGVRFGQGARVLGDVDGDGIKDLLVGEDHFASQGLFVGRAFLVLGQRYGAPSLYCTAKTNSLNCLPTIGWSGNLPSVTDIDPFYVNANNVINQKPGLAFYGLHGRNLAPFQGGTLCVLSPLRRTLLQSSGGNSAGLDCSGTYSLDWRAWMLAALDPALTVGTTVNMQYYMRDPVASFTVGLTNGIEFTIGP